MGNSYLCTCTVFHVCMPAAFLLGVGMGIHFFFSYIATHTDTILVHREWGACVDRLYLSSCTVLQICTTSLFLPQGAKKDIAHSFPCTPLHIYMPLVCRTYPDPGCAAQSQHGTWFCYSWLVMSCYNQCCGEDLAQRRRWRVWGRGTSPLQTPLQVLSALPGCHTTWPVPVRGWCSTLVCGSREGCWPTSVDRGAWPLLSSRLLSSRVLLPHFPF